MIAESSFGLIRELIVSELLVVDWLRKVSYGPK